MYTFGDYCIVTRKQYTTHDNVATRRPSLEIFNEGKKKQCKKSR